MLLRKKECYCQKFEAEEKIVWGLRFCQPSTNDTNNGVNICHWNTHSASYTHLQTSPKCPTLWRMLFPLATIRCKDISSGELTICNNTTSNFPNGWNSSHQLLQGKCVSKKNMAKYTNLSNNQRAGSIKRKKTVSISYGTFHGTDAYQGASFIN